jgi:hypothetical protein
VQEIGMKERTPRTQLPDRIPKTVWLAVEAGGLIILGCLLSWVNALPESGVRAVTGIDTAAGKLVLICAATGCLGLALALVRRGHHHGMARLAVLAALLGLGTGLYQTVRAEQTVHGVAASTAPLAEVGLGLWLIDFAGLAFVVLIVVALRSCTDTLSEDTEAARVYLTEIHVPTPPDASAPVSALARREVLAAEAAQIPAPVIRRWARDHDVEVRTQGPIPRRVRDLYVANVGVFAGG